MWQISGDAMAYLEKRQSTVLTVEQPIPVSGCCIHIAEPPGVKLGEPKAGERYTPLEVQGVKVYIPPHLLNLDLTIDVTKFWRKEKLVIEGWKLV